MMTGLSLPLGVNTNTSTQNQAVSLSSDQHCTEGASQHNLARKKASILKKNKIVFIHRKTQSSV